jgi:AcrR family transcriptional regulator
MDTRTKILETATRLFASHGYDSTSLSLVARDASVSKALIFWHFESKENLFEAVLARTIEPYRIDNADLEGLGEFDQLALLVDQYYEFLTENLSSVRFFLSLFLRDEKRPDEFFSRVLDLYRGYNQIVAEVLRSGQQKGLISRDVDPELRATLLLSALNGILVQGFTDEGPDAPPPERLVRELKASLLDSLRVQ